jgi:ketosteroid isomerase-like protein
MRSILAAVIALSIAHGETNAEFTEQVRRTEIAFAKTMADRDHKAFTAFLSPEAMFTNAQGKSMRGVAVVTAGWKSLYEGEKSFSWAPETVQVLDSGTLAFSSGTVLDAAGRRVGTFNSVWRRESDGSWKIV